MAGAINGLNATFIPHMGQELAPGNHLLNGFEGLGEPDVHKLSDGVEIRHTAP